MQAKVRTLRTIFSARRLMHATVGLGLLLVFGFAQAGFAQCNPLCLSNNYFVTGDYVVGGVGLRGLGNATTNLATGTITIPDSEQAKATLVPSPGVPAGADIVAAFLYWETVEKGNSAFAGEHGFFNGYPITGKVLGNGSAPPSWSSGGCAGSSNGTTTLRVYRADVRPFLPVDSNGKIQTPNAVTPGSYQISLADSGSNGGGTPLTLGASLVIIYRVQSPLVSLNSIVLYDGAFAPSNQTTGSEMTQTMQGFYQAAVTTTRNSKLTHIVGDGQPNKSESVTLNNAPLPNLYPAISTTAAFPGVYNGSWDNATWSFSNANGGRNPVGAGASLAVTSVIPSGSGGGCVDWGAVIFSTTVEDTNHDGLLAAWKAATPPGYTDAISIQNGISNPFVALPGASKSAQDIFVEIDYLTLRDSNGNILHSHLPKQLALDMVGDAFAKQKINVHFDVGTNFNSVCKLTPPVGNQQSCPALDPYIIQGGSGGNEIPESAVLCTDLNSPTPCHFPGTPAVEWKEGFLFVKNLATVPGTNVPLGNFQFGRKDSYHYVLFGHALGMPRSFWTTWAGFGANQSNTALAQLTSIVVSTVNSVTTTTVTIQTPPPPASQGGLLKPGDCPTNPLIPACNDLNLDRVTVGGAIGQPALNGTYHFTNLSSSTDNTGVSTTKFNITTTGVADGTYNFSNESRLAVVYGGPTSTSGRSDFPGGADSAVMFGLWPADDVSGCQPDPSMTLNSGQVYCVDQVGTITAEAGTLLHELGHTLTLAHGGTGFPNGAITDPQNPLAGQQTNNPPGVASYGLNCNPAFLSSMNYLFQIRGFPDPGHPIDYSGQTLPSLSEAALNETVGIGSDVFTGSPAAHFTRWYAPPNVLQTQIGHFATLHCDGTPIGPNEPPAVRVDGNTFSAPIDWNNDNTIETGTIAWQDVNFNGSTSSAPDPAPPPAFNNMQGFNDWINVDLRQVGSRANSFGFSGGGTVADLSGTGGALADLSGGGGTVADLSGTGGTVADLSGTGGVPADLTGTGGALADLSGSGGTEQDTDTACSTADPPTLLPAVLGSKSVVLTWFAPGGPCQVLQYDIWRATSPSTTFTDIQILGRITKGNKTTAPPTKFTDTNVKNNTTYTYFVTDHNVQGAGSDASNRVTILVKF